LVATSATASGFFPYPKKTGIPSSLTAPATYVHLRFDSQR
jgi:hypothetical protein